MTEKIRVGIIGANANYGWSKRAHLPALLGMPDFELTAVCTSRPETAAESKDFYGAKLAFHDYAEMASHPEVDLVVVSVSVPAHHGMVTRRAAGRKARFLRVAPGGKHRGSNGTGRPGKVQGCQYSYWAAGAGRPGSAAAERAGDRGLCGGNARLQHDHVSARPPATGRRPRLDGRPGQRGKQPDHCLRARPRHLLPLRGRIPRAKCAGQRAAGTMAYQRRENGLRGRRG